MSERKQATVEVAEISTRAVGAEKKTMWTLKDSHGTEYTTFVPAIGNGALPYQGGTALIEWTEKENHKDGRVYINRYLESVQPTSQQAEPSEAKPVKAPDEPVDWDSKERRQFKSRAWAQAISALQHTGNPDETPKQVYVRVKPLADAIYRDVCGEFADGVALGISGSELSMGAGHPDDNIPFAPTVA